MIPKHIFFVLFPPLNKKGVSRPFSLLHYLALKSAHVCNPTYKLSLYCNEEPTGEYWDMIKSVVNIVITEPPTEVFGNKIYHVAHQSDVVRLRTLLEVGGIYLDMDTITVKSFDNLMSYPAVIGYEGIRNSGLCNAVIFSEPNNKFISDWYNEYTTFSSKGKDKDWATHSIKLPLKMWNSGKYINDIKVMPFDTFHYPLWYKKGSIMLWEECHTFPNAIIHHVWESVNRKYIADLTIEKIKTVDNTYTKIARRYL